MPTRMAIPIVATSSRSVSELINKSKISCVIVLCQTMANDEKVPELEEILEKNFAEMKIGEDKFQQNEPAKQNISISKKIIYQERYSSENQTGTITVKPIKATKDTIHASIDIKDETIDKVIEQQQDEVETQVLDAPTSSIGDDFAVDW